MILCVGEILADMIGTEQNGQFCYERKAGGAPFNVACAAGKFGADVSFVGCVGNDLIGEFLIGFAQKQALRKAAVSVDPRRNTTLAFVQLDASGERSFCFYRHNTADCRLPKIDPSDLRQASTVHIGSLMLSEPEGVQYASDLAKAAHELDIPVSFDVNYRTDIFKDPASALSAYRKILKVADLIKFSEDEVDIFSENYIREELKDKAVFITHGKNGAEWRFGKKHRTVPTATVTPVDTTGAGDAFWGGVLSRLDGIPMKTYTEELLNGAVRFGNIAGALNTLGKGAIDALPSVRQIEELLKATAF